MRPPAPRGSGAVLGASSKPPPGYVAGIGRGERGLGDTRNRGTYSKAQVGKDRAETRKRALATATDTTFKHGGSGTKEDVEADAVYDEVDARMAGRRVERDGERPAKRLATAELFADAKLKLASMKYEDWEAIPDSVADYSGRNKLDKRRSWASQREGPVSDAMLLEAKGVATGTTAADAAPAGGGASSLPGSGGATDLTGVGTARSKMLDLRLTSMEDSVSGQTVVDPQGFVTSLQAQREAQHYDASDKKRGRLLMRSLTASNPHTPQGWIAAARFEETAQNPAEARRLIKEGCEKCPRSEEIWLEAARLCRPSEAQGVLARAVRHVPTSVGVWVRAAELEDRPEAKRAVLRRALQLVPTSVRLWRQAVSLEDPESARVMLAQAVRIVPQSVELWLALARLETYDNARKVLRAANKALPREPKLFVAAARLEEQSGNASRVGRIIKQAVQRLVGAAGATKPSAAAEAASASGSAAGRAGGAAASELSLRDREVWLGLARSAEGAGFPETAAALVECSIGIGVEAADEVRTWTADAAQLEREGRFHCARAALRRAVEGYKDRRGLWIRAAELERRHGSPGALDALLQRAVTHCPRAEELWLRAARLKWDEGDVEGARRVLAEAFSVNEGSEPIMLAAVKLEREAGSSDAARALLGKARSTLDSERVWTRSAVVEAEDGRLDAAADLLKTALKRFPDAARLWLLVACVERRRGDAAKALKLLQGGIKYCPASVPLWREAARAEELAEGAARARSTLELARVRCPKAPLLWLDAVRLESRAGNGPVADSMLAQAIQECPASAALWAERIQRAPKVEHSGLAKRAAKSLVDDGEFAVTVGRMLWRNGMTGKARSWLARAVKLSPLLGDAWCSLLRLEQECGSPGAPFEVLKAARAAAPKYGEHWAPIAKRIENRRRPLDHVLVAAAAALPPVTESVRTHAVWEPAEGERGVVVPDEVDVPGPVEEDGAPAAAETSAGAAAAASASSSSSSSSGAEA